MTLQASSLQSSLAGSLIESVLGQAQQAQTELAMQMARISLAQNISTAAVNGAGSMVDAIA